MSNKSLKIEKYEKYYGTADEIKQRMVHCPKCGTEFEVTHLADHDNQYIHEEVKCTKCSWGTEESLHQLH